VTVVAAVVVPPFVGYGCRGRRKKILDVKEGNHDGLDL
jgi:hypothetical protein